MLAKQGWRILNESNTLVSAIMKAKYFPNTDFLSAQLGSNPSYVWRSIMSAQETVRMGARRKIGDGADTKVWGVPWLPDKENGCLTSYMPERLRESRVQNLMDIEGQRWETDILQDICNTRDVELILRIPIPMNKGKDA
ncbi:putative mitochondrial protein AtMg00310 [Apium graveolens]|uniref:putative mitochondrial protein AtMg00310 n=1 Tax=Apium graveolens TaxID=4045 RepID=UPI003D798A62